MVSRSAKLKAIHYNYDTKSHEYSEEFAENIIFTRDFYEDLLIDIRLQKRCILTGNEGIGKRSFLQYYLARIMNPDLFGPLPPDCNGCTDAPKYVIWQVWDRMTVYDIENRRKHECDANKRYLICFNPMTTLYFVEPSANQSGAYYSGLELPILAVMNTDTDSKRLIKDYAVNGAV